jgi:glutaredoxin
MTIIIYNDYKGEKFMIELYILETCPYCHRVMDFMDKESIKYEKKDVTKPENHEKLMKLGGLSQVPFLYDDGVALYDSDKIIEYLTTRC